MAEAIISGIYTIRNTKNGKVYVGSSMNVRSRWYFHKNDLRKNKHHSLLLQRAWNKDGEDSFRFSIVEECDCSQLLAVEQSWIDRLNCADKRYGYNRSPSAGNTAGIKRTEEFKKKISDAKKGCPAWNKGLTTGKQTPEMIEKRFAKLRGVKRDPSIGAKISATKKALGQKPSKQTLLAASVARKGSKHTEETKAKMSAAHLARSLKMISAKTDSSHTRSVRASPVALDC